MSLHPIRVLDRVIEEYRDSLTTEFRAKDQSLKQALERELDRPRFLAQEAFFQAHRPFRPGDGSYRVIPAETAAGDLVMSHISVNFDRSGFQEDVSVVFPLDRLRELEADGEIGSVSQFHYSFMGAAPILSLEPKARELALLLKKDRVDAVLLTPV